MKDNSTTLHFFSRIFVLRIVTHAQPSVFVAIRSRFGDYLPELHIIVCLNDTIGIRSAWWSDKSRHVLCPCNVRPHTHTLPKTQLIDTSFDRPFSHSYLAFLFSYFSPERRQY